MRLINRCPHVRIRGIYGDEINHTPGSRRLQCVDCGRILDGPVRLATVGWTGLLPNEKWKGYLPNEGGDTP